MQTRKEIVFPPFRLDVANVRLWREDEVIVIRPKTFDVLRCLVERAGQLVTKEEILATVWPGAMVSSAGIASSARLSGVRLSLTPPLRQPISSYRCLTNRQ